VSESRATGVKVHIGRIFGIEVETSTQFSLGDPMRKMKGRIVFHCNEVHDEKHDDALYVASAPAAVDASNACYAYGLPCGRHVQQCDALQAYTQTNLGGDVITWVRLPREFWPESWHKLGYIDPVVPLVKALYGHPRAGHCWEQRAEKHMSAAGLQNLGGW